MNDLSVWDYFTIEQQEKMTKRMEQFTFDQLYSFRKESADLIAKLRVEMRKNSPVQNLEVLQLAKRLKKLSDAFMEHCSC